MFVCFLSHLLISTPSGWLLAISRRTGVLARMFTVLFLEYSSAHPDSLLVFTDSSKFGAGAGYGVAFPYFCRGDILPSVAFVFIVELSTIVLALQFYFYMLIIVSIINFSDSTSVFLSGLL